jgi:hypothetical protein
MKQGQAVSSASPICLDGARSGPSGRKSHTAPFPREEFHAGEARVNDIITSRQAGSKNSFGAGIIYVRISCLSID